MFCSGCGREVSKEAAFCEACGAPLSSVGTLAGNEEKTTKEEINPPLSGLGVASLVISILGIFVAGIILGTLAIVFGLIGMSQCDKGQFSGKGFARSGLIIGIVDVVGAIFILLCYL